MFNKQFMGYSLMLIVSPSNTKDRVSKEDVILLLLIELVLSAILSKSCDSILIEQHFCIITDKNNDKALIITAKTETLSVHFIVRSCCSSLDKKLSFSSSTRGERGTITL